MKAMREASDWVMYAGMLVAMVGGATWPRPTWVAVAGGLAIIGAGVAMRRAAGGSSLAEETGVVDARRPPRQGTLVDGVTAFVAGIEALLGEAEGLPLETIKTRVDDLLWIGPERLGSAQEVIAARAGFAAYAEVMAPLASAERWLNRAWSAAADEHRPECVASLETALTFARDAALVAPARLAPLVSS